jgi:pimeloyl-ACP methyl ester carboxylesterase
MPGATREQADSFNELQRRTTSPECAVRYLETVGDFDVTDLLAKVNVPTLVMHVRGDLMNPFEFGRRMAAGIPGAHFVALQGQNHLLLPGEPAAVRFREELKLFLAE